MAQHGRPLVSGHELGLPADQAAGQGFSAPRPGGQGSRQGKKAKSRCLLALTFGSDHSLVLHGQAIESAMEVVPHEPEVVHPIDAVAILDYLDYCERRGDSNHEQDPPPVSPDNVE